MDLGSSELHRPVTEGAAEAAGPPDREEGLAVLLRGQLDLEIDDATKEEGIGLPRKEPLDVVGRALVLIPRWKGDDELEDSRELRGQTFEQREHRDEGVTFGVFQLNLDPDARHLDHFDPSPALHCFQDSLIFLDRCLGQSTMRQDPVLERWGAFEMCRSRVYGPEDNKQSGGAEQLRKPEGQGEVVAVDQSSGRTWQLVAEIASVSRRVGVLVATYC